MLSRGEEIGSAFVDIATELHIAGVGLGGMPPAKEHVMTSRRNCGECHLSVLSFPRSPPTFNFTSNAPGNTLDHMDIHSRLLRAYCLHHRKQYYS
mmetsp:Transcript_18908/g.44302  ORF Transcript_18908/g.44302 Transcript_18908/m.44302 type:complete len:95 (+) Transcript_18908:4238-4522(+)